MEFDAHRIDVEWHLLVPNARGELVPMAISSIVDCVFVVETGFDRYRLPDLGCAVLGDILRCALQGITYAVVDQ